VSMLNIKQTERNAVTMSDKPDQSEEAGDVAQDSLEEGEIGNSDAEEETSAKLRGSVTKAYNCLYCSKMYTCMDNLDRHVR